VPLDLEAVEQVGRVAGVEVYPPAHAKEHSLEVVLPFLQVALGRFEIVPLVVGEAGDRLVAEVIGHLWGGPETRFVLSSDLSHYLEYQAAREMDEETAAWIREGKWTLLEEERACGCQAIRAFLQVCGERGAARAELVDLRNSGDTAGQRDAVVGYGAFHLGCGGR
jgi:MEMO1 family protein